MDRRQRVLLTVVIIALVVCLVVALVLTLRMDHEADDESGSGGRRPVTTEVVAHRGEHSIRELGRAS